MRIFVCVLLLVAAAAHAQAPDEEWWTIESAHFRIHYPRTHEAWARHAAARIESIRARVGEAVGHTPAEKIDVIIGDPISQANGIAWPLLGWPRMLLWTNPPGPESVIGNYSDWTELLIVHEQTHLAHLLRPSRNHLRQLASRILPVGPVASSSPRWVTEGYATVIEGELTGRGRPNSALRAAILRRWAQLGRLPAFAQLSSDARNWLGMSMAYLVGSAYLEWLQERGGPDSLPKLWRRMSARADRSFDEAFAGVFGDSPQRLYGRYVAELTEQSMGIEEVVEPIRHDGDLWQDLAWATEAPSLSQDGTELVTVIRGRDNPSRMVIFSTAPPTEEEKKWNERIERMLKRDPEDVPPVRTKPLARKPLHKLETRNGAEPFGPKWLPDGSILFVRFEPDNDGFLEPDLFRWVPGGRAVERLTRGASVRDVSPSRNGTWAAAVRNVNGLSQLVRVDLRDGAVSSLTDPAVDRVYDSPALSPDGTKLAYVVHRDGRWRLVIRDLGTNAESEPNLGPADVVAHPAWSDRGELLAVIGHAGGFLEIHRIDLDQQRAPERITQGHSASLAPVIAPDRSIYYLSLDIDGFDIRRISAEGSDPPEVADILAAEVRSKASPPPFETSTPPPARPYGIGPQEWTMLFGGNYAPAARNFEVGLRSGDVVGRLSAIAFASTANDRGVEGVAVAATWRGSPVAITAHAYTAEEKFPRQEPIDRDGLELRGSWDRRWRGGRVEIAGGALVEELQGVQRRFGFLHSAIAQRVTFGNVAITQNASAQFESGTTASSAWSRLAGRGLLAVERDDERLELSLHRGSLSDANDRELFSIGGVASTILPDRAVSYRQFVPALPAEFVRGDRTETQRIAARTRLAPMTVFYERHRVWMSDDGHGPWLAL
ncbi:MAG TPA: hypothetical protein VIL97_05105, partial [Thermoanaerobaculia bacterium]